MTAITDYSKWDHIDISDDESDCHPNIEKETWFRLKRRQREEKEQEQNARKAELEKGIKAGLARVAELEQRAAAVKAEGGDVDGEDPVALTVEAEELQKAVEAKRKEVESIERNKIWNWENMCHVTEERTIINKSADSEGKDTMMRSALPPKLAAALGEKPRAVTAPGPETTTQEVQSYSDFVKEHEGVMEKYSELHSMEKTRDFLRQHGDILFADHCQSYLLLSCLEDEMNGKHERMKLVARQSQLLSSITELAVSLRRPPQDVVPALFLRLDEAEHSQRFRDGVNDFVAKVQNRAVEKRKEMEAEEAEGLDHETVELTKEERMGPGGLDPLEVFPTLPEKMQIAFDQKDTPMLQEALLELTDEERKYHMKRVVDSGLWVPGAGGSTRVEDEEYDDDDDDEAAGQAVGVVTGEASGTKVPASPPSPTGAGSSEEA
ncbi:unnamed protein product [Ectocarpus sp. CCAP 1310/34]|nr:unnamed protein product [Ectocarpus sp. CCAP 1310/34]